MALYTLFFKKRLRNDNIEFQQNKKEYISLFFIVNFFIKTLISTIIRVY